MRDRYDFGDSKPTPYARLTLDFWLDDGWYVGKLREVPNVLSQGASLEELKANIQDAYRLMMKGATAPPASAFRSVEVSVCGD